MQIKGLFKKNIHKNKINNLDSSNINVPDGLYTEMSGLFKNNLNRGHVSE